VEYTSTVRGRRLIREIERLRHASGLPMEAAAQRLGWSTSKLYRLEAGRSRITTDDLADMLDLYGVRSPQREALIQLGRDARRRGWWITYSDVFTGSYIAMEAEAASIRINAHLMPGIFQTPGYAHEMIRRTRPAISAEDAARRVAARTARQDALSSRPQPPQIHVILDEAVLHRQVGGPAVTGQQLTALAETATWPNVTVQVLPFTAGANAGGPLRTGPFRTQVPLPLRHLEWRKSMGAERSVVSAPRHGTASSARMPNTDTKVGHAGRYCPWGIARSHADSNATAHALTMAGASVASLPSGANSPSPVK
jgi:transcriptional regulator with XRE-family HTH domain